MDGVTIGQVGEWLLWAVGIGGAIATVCKFLTFAFQRTLNKALEPTNKKIDEINRKVDLLEAKHDESEMGRIKDFLVEFLARIERGEPVDEEELGDSGKITTSTTTTEVTHTYIARWKN